MSNYLLHIEKCGLNELDKDRRELSHYLIISLSHYRGRLKDGCIVVMGRFIEYIAGLNVTLSEAKSPEKTTTGYFTTFSMTITYIKTEEPSKIIDYSANGETGYYAEDDIVKDQLKRFSPALNLKCTVGILHNTDLLNFINMHNDLHRCIYSEAA